MMQTGDLKDKFYCSIITFPFFVSILYGFVKKRVELHLTCVLYYVRYGCIRQYCAWV